LPSAETQQTKLLVERISKDDKISPAKAIEDLTEAIRALCRTNEKYHLALAYAIRGTAFACGMENRKAAFRDWRKVLKLILEGRNHSPDGLKLIGWVRLQMGLHSRGKAQMRHFGEALGYYRRAGRPQGEATVLVERGLRWKERGYHGRALKDLLTGLRIAREHDMEEIQQLEGFVREVEEMRKRNRR